MPKFLTTCRRSATRTLLSGMLRLGGWLGPGGAIGLGRLLGGVCGFTGPLRKRLAANFRAAGIEPTKDLLDRYFQRLGLWAGWSLAVYEHGLERSGIVQRIEFANSLAYLDEAAAQGRGVIVAAPHFFAHEITAAVAGRRHPFAALVRESKSAAHNDVKRHWYGALGMEMVHRARRSSMLADAVALIRVLRSGRVLGITPDVLVPEDQGMPVTMFGRTVSLAPGFAFLAMRSGAPVLTSHLEWLTPENPREARIRVHCHPPMRMPEGGNREALREAMQSWCSHYETLLRQNPENWLFWLDKNWTRVLQGSVTPS